MGINALELARIHVPDLVLLDVMMPGMDGFEVCEQMRRDPLLADVPIVMVTALDGREARLKGIRVGADDFISKPYDRMELRARVQTITRLNRYRRIQAERVKFEWVVDRANQGYLILDEVGQIQYMNNQARILLGWDGPLDPGHSPAFLDLARLTYRFEPAASWAEWPSSPWGDASRYLVRSESDHSLAFWLQVDVVDLPQGSGGGILVHLRTVTDRVNRTRTQRTFFSLIHHRLRTPITMILGGLEFLANGTDVGPGQRDRVATVHRQARQLEQEIQDVLAHLDSPGGYKQNPGMPLADLPDLILASIQRLGLQRVTWTVPSQLGDAQLRLGRRFIELILLEILQNARKHHPDGHPAISIQVTLPTSDSVHLHIRDDGVHLSPEALAAALNPFAASEQGVGDQGVGLGFSTIVSILWSVGGRCQLANRPDAPGIEVNLPIPLLSAPSY